MDLNEKSLHTLELDQVLALLAECAGSEEGKNRCRNLRPVCDLDDVLALQTETSAACRLLALKGNPGFSGVKDVAMTLERADRGGCLNAAELLRIAGVLRAARLVQDYASGEAVEPCLRVLFEMLSPNKFFEERITAAILSEEEIADAASPELANIRRLMRVQSAKVRDVLQHIISSPSNSKYLREPIITLRNDRYVVPVRSEFKNNIPGLIHDVSSSGGTFFVEPMQVVKANNELRELLEREQREIERILAEFSAEAAGNKDRINENFRVLTRLDTIFARASLSYKMRACPPEIRTDGRLDLKRARHPLLDPKKAVPISVRLGSDFDTLVITGPNTGGKTVTLKTIGLLTLMAECGLHIPADDGSAVSLFAQVFADIGDEQSIEQSLSTFSSHMKNIVEIIDTCTQDSLILFDELGAGTDPAEGAALAVSVIEFCRKMGARVAATTHYAELKVYGMRTPGVSNASCEFDVETLQPTYRLLIGIPGKSNAFAISRRLGLSEEIIKSAKDLVSENDQNFEDILNQLEQQRQAMEQARMEAEQLRLQTAQAKEKSDEYYRQIKRERDKAAEAARAEAQHIIDEARETANAVYAELKELRKQVKDAGDLQGVNERQANLRHALNEAEDRLAGERQAPERPAPTREIRVGDTVELKKISSRASVLAIGADGTLQLQAGILKITARPDEVYLLENERQDTKKFIEKAKRELRNIPTPSELDLRGMSAGEAIPVLDNFLDAAMLANLNSVRIIHGKGTGVLRREVQNHLKRCRTVKSYRLGVYGEGEDGVTIAELR